MKPILYVVSGAGLSAESGVSTFRTAGGLWSQHDRNRVCNAFTWKQYRNEVFEFYVNRRREANSVQPNTAHLRLARWQAFWGPDRVQLLTQNVDGLLERAGAQAVTHLHGDLLHLHCTACGHRWEVTDEEYRDGTRCVKCSSLRGVKPGVVLFNERAPEYEKLQKLHKSIRHEDALLVIGSALEVVTVEHLMPRWRFGHGLNWQVNLEPAHSSYFGLNIAEGACAGLEKLELRVAEAMNIDVCLS